MHLEVMNLHGQIVFSKKLNPNQNAYTWNAEQQPDGIYLAKLKSDNKTLSTLKLVLMK